MVVDTGIHAKGLTRQEALELFDKYAWDNTDIAEKEVTRYHSAFGHATAYMIGRLRFKELRDYTKAMLGEMFSLKEFHYQVLLQGPTPLDYMESHVHRFVQCSINKTENCDDILSPPITEMKENNQRKMVAGKPAKPRRPKVHQRHYL